MSRVPNQFPTRAASYRLAFVGEAPGQDEERLGVPFIGSSGKLLDAHLDAIPGLSRASCFVGNVSQVRPPGGNEFWRFLTWRDERIQAGIAQLLSDLASFAPNLIVCLGNASLHLLRHGNVSPPRTKTGFQWPSAITKWRGSLFLSHPSLSDPNATCDKCAAGYPLDDCPDCAAMRAVVPHQLCAQPNLKPSSCEAVGGVVKGSVPVDSTSSAQGRLSTAPPFPGPDLTASQPVEKPDACDAVGRETAHDSANQAVAGSPLRWKCLATLHPAYVLRQWSSGFSLHQDLLRARAEAGDPRLVLDPLEIVWGPATVTTPNDNDVTF